MSSGCVTIDPVKRVKAARANKSMERTGTEILVLSSRLLAAAHLNR